MCLYGVRYQVNKENVVVIREREGETQGLLQERKGEEGVSHPHFEINTKEDIREKRTEGMWCAARAVYFAPGKREDCHRQGGDTKKWGRIERLSATVHRHALGLCSNLEGITSEQEYFLFKKNA
jgi:hypothetical protein